MKVEITHPTKAYIQATESEIRLLREFLTYTNKSIAFQLKKHYNNMRWKRYNMVTWSEAGEKLESKLKNTLLYQEGDQYWVRSGVVPFLYLQFNNLKVVNKLKYAEYKPLPWKEKPHFTPYDYQTRSVEMLMKIKHGHISLPTGSGKSFVLLLACRNMGLDCVVVTPSKSIFNELLTEFQTKLGKKWVGGYGDGKKDIGKKITIAIGKSLTMLKPDTKEYEHFKNKQAMLVDESHCFAADQLEKVSHGVLSDIPIRFFVSATQTRNDGGEKLLFSIIGDNVMTMTLQEAISKKFLCPLKFKVLQTFSPSTREIPDPLECKREHFLYNPEIAKLSAKLANAMARSKNLSTLILVEELRQIQALIQYLEVDCAYVHSSSKKEAAKFGLQAVKLQDEVDKFNLGKVKVLIGTRAIATGTNIYPTHNTINWMGGSSEIITKQGAMGRSTRILEKSIYKKYHEPKENAMIWDFNVKDCEILSNQLEKRISFYEESGEKVEWL